VGEKIEGKLYRRKRGIYLPESKKTPKLLMPADYSDLEEKKKADNPDLEEKKE
jgi:hypothetical protein